MAKRKQTFLELWKSFQLLSDGDQRQFVSLMSDDLILANPAVQKAVRKAVQQSFDQTIETVTQLHTRIMRARIPRKRGKPERDEIITRLKRRGMSDGEIGRDPEVMAANDGKRMMRGAVQQVRLRKKG